MALCLVCETLVCDACPGALFPFSCFGLPRIYSTPQRQASPTSPLITSWDHPRILMCSPASLKPSRLVCCVPIPLLSSRAVCRGGDTYACYSRACYRTA